MKALHLAEKKSIPLGDPQGRNHWWHTQKHHRKLESPRRGISRPIYGQMFNDVFKMLVDTRFVMVVDTFIKVDPFGSSTKNDATGGTKLFGPTRELFYGVKVRF